MCEDMQTNLWPEVELNQVTGVNAFQRVWIEFKSTILVSHLDNVRHHTPWRHGKVLCRGGLEEDGCCGSGEE